MNKTEKAFKISEDKAKMEINIIQMAKLRKLSTKILDEYKNDFGFFPALFQSLIKLSVDNNNIILFGMIVNYFSKEEIKKINKCGLNDCYFHTILERAVHFKKYEIASMLINTILESGLEKIKLEE